MGGTSGTNSPGVLGVEAVGGTSGTNSPGVLGVEAVGGTSGTNSPGVWVLRQWVVLMIFNGAGLIIWVGLICRGEFYCGDEWWGSE